MTSGGRKSGNEMDGSSAPPSPDLLARKSSLFYDEDGRVVMSPVSGVSSMFDDERNEQTAEIVRQTTLEMGKVAIERFRIRKSSSVKEATTAQEEDDEEPVGHDEEGGDIKVCMQPSMYLPITSATVSFSPPYLHTGIHQV